MIWSKEQLQMFAMCFEDIEDKASDMFIDWWFKEHNIPGGDKNHPKYKQLFSGLSKQLDDGNFFGFTEDYSQLKVFHADQIYYFPIESLYRY